MVCPDGKYSMPGSDDSGDCLCPPNAYSQQNARYVTECICDSGYYKEYNGLFALGGWYCKLCLPGEFCYNNTNRTCPDHSSSYGVAKTYLDCFCDAGYRNVTTARTEQAFCEDCPANNYCTGKGDVQSCVANAVSPTQSKIYTRCYCDFGWKGVNNSACVGCQSPTYCYGGVEAQCSEGTYSPSLAWDRLNCSCIAGRWGPTGGPCIICSAGKYNTFPGCIACSNTTDLDCSLCEIGTASSALGRNTTCDVCPAGKYSYPPNQKGATTCVDCGNGTFSGVGAGNCTPCADGRYSTGGAGVCTLCPTGTYGGGMVSVCTSCPAGMYGILAPDSGIRTYPPKSFDYGTAETDSTFLGRPAFSQNITLNSTGISYGVGQYSLFFSSKAIDYRTQKSNMFSSNRELSYWQAKAYLSGDFNTAYVNNTYISSDYPGEWLVVQLPYLIRLTGYAMTPGISALYFPGEFKMYGSSDGWSFTEIPQASVMNRLGISAYPYNKTVTPASDPILYLGFTVNKLDIWPPTPERLQLSKFIIYGTEFLDLWTLPDRCASCPTGTYSTVLGSPSSLTCTNCKAGTYSTVVGAASIFDCSACLAGTYSLLGAYGCQPCSPGTYSTAVGSVNISTCAACLAGTFLTQQGGTGCDQCLAGYFSGVSGLNTTCGTCMAGKYSFPANQKGATFCEACANGTVSGVGSGNCTSCLNGSYAVSGDSVCTQCAAGTYGIGVIGICTSCSTGKYSPTNGATVCLECGTGTYSTTARAWNASQCTACIPGTYSTTSGAWNSTQCTPCSPGKYSTILGAPAPSNCSACLPGKVSDKAGSVDCSVCSPGTYAPIQSSACTFCVEGTYSLFQASVCTTCEPGSFSPINAPVCMSCPEGTYTTGSGSGNCSQCEAGTYSLRAAAVCSICGIGTFNAERGRWNCTDCLDGAFAGEGETEVRKRRRRRPHVACLIRDSSDPHVLFWARSVPSVSRGRGGWGDWNRIRTARGAVQGDTRPCWADRAPTSARRARLANFPTRQGRAR